MSALEKGQHDTKAKDGTGKIATDLSARVTICFKGVPPCDSQSIKQYIQRTRHRRSHPLPHVLEDTNTVHDWLYQLFSAHKWASEPCLVGCTGNEPENGEIMFSVLFISVGLCTKKHTTRFMWSDHLSVTGQICSANKLMVTNHMLRQTPTALGRVDTPAHGLHFKILVPSYLKPPSFLISHANTLSTLSHHAELFFIFLFFLHCALQCSTGALGVINLLSCDFTTAAVPCEDNFVHILCKDHFFCKIWHQFMFDVCAPHGFNEQISRGDVSREAQRRRRIHTAGLTFSVPFPPPAHFHVYRTASCAFTWFCLLVLCTPQRQTSIVVGLYGSHAFGVFISDLFFTSSKISKVLKWVSNLKTSHSKTNVRFQKSLWTTLPFHSLINKCAFFCGLKAKIYVEIEFTHMWVCTHKCFSPKSAWVNVQ